MKIVILDGAIESRQCGLEPSCRSRRVVKGSQFKNNAQHFTIEPYYQIIAKVDLSPVLPLDMPMTSL
ncbi:MAG: hypothetical protein LBN28_06275 [Desulfovibrio sp.]|nr:hypothetical protein [Desulfovibrio sp.]